MKPILFVTGHAPPDRLGAFGALHEREGALFALFGGRSAHGAPAASEPDFPHLRPTQREVGRLAASGDFRAVVCGTGGRVALPAAVAGARRAGIPFLLWASLWAHPRTPVHMAGYPGLLWLYSHADAVVTYGEHVSAYVLARGARNVHVAPQSVDNDYWSSPVGASSRRPGFTTLWVGRPAPEKGVNVLIDAWRQSELAAHGGRLVLVGALDRVAPDVLGDQSIECPGRLGPAELRNFYASADVLVVPSIPTRTFREPWGLVVNEGMNQGLPVIATDSVGAAAGGLVRHERNGLVLSSGDPAGLARALRRVHADEELRDRLSGAARRDIAAFTHRAWASGFSAALASVSASTGPS